ncbi:MAG: HD domain-containing protein [Spirochaetaceae bacterium]|nr:HD domain-containing protein [Spirochaetaceae bacterium]
MTAELLLTHLQSFPVEERTRLEKVFREAAPDEYAAGVAGIALELGLDADCVVAALLHYGLKDKEAFDEFDEKRIADGYGASVAALMAEARRVEGISAKGKTNLEAENIRKMLFAMIHDVRVLFLRLADRLQTLRTLKGKPEEEQKRTAQECLDIYAPLADRFGVSWLKADIEDLSLKYLNREAFNQVKEIVALKKTERQNFLDTIQVILTQEAHKAGLKIEVNSRAKHFYSIYQKMRKRNKNAQDMYDLFGIRIFCDTMEACYTMLGILHSLWKPLHGRFKDYIAMPKANGYQSLHTTVMTGLDCGGSANHIEIQIRTFDMHNVAEHGIASHWLYKKGTTSELVHADYLPVVNKLKTFLSDRHGRFQPCLQHEEGDSFLVELKKEILRDSIFVFTPQGKVVELPSGATALDFAYSIHSAIGDHCSLAKADGRIISLSLPLQNTQVIEIATSQAAHPHQNWLNVVKTAKARNKIRQWLAANDEALIAERNLLEKKKRAAAEAAALRTHEAKHDETQPARATQSAAEPVHVRVEDQRNLLVRFAKCCNPVLGSDIVGFVSRGRGIVIHRKGCKSLPYIKEFEERRIDTEWDYQI